MARFLVSGQAIGSFSQMIEADTEEDARARVLAEFDDPGSDIDIDEIDTVHVHSVAKIEMPKK